jgi:hypothetical protein
LLLRDIGAGALLVANRQQGQTLKGAVRTLSLLYGLKIPPTTAREWSLRWVKLQQQLGVEPARVPSKQEARRTRLDARRRDRVEADLEETRRSLAYRAMRAGVAAQDVPRAVAAMMRGDPVPSVASKRASQAVAAERLGKVLEAQARVQELSPPASDIVVSEVELRRLGRGWRERARSLRSP